MTTADQIAALANMPVAELAARYIELFGHPPRSRRNAAFLRKRLAFKLQENALGGLPRVARAALERLTAEIVLPPAVTAPATDRATPGPGRILEREWRGQTVRVVTTADGFEWNGQRFGSLSAVAFAITGAKWNGKLFFNLVTRKTAR